MFERFSPSAKAAVKAAQHQASQGRASEVRPTHLLQALLAEDADVTTLLATLGTEPRDLRRALEGHTADLPDGLDADDAEALATIGIDLAEVTRRLGPDLAPTRRGAHPPYARGTTKALEFALREAINLGHRAIDGRHLLLGLARGGDRTVTDALAACALDLPTIRAAVIARGKAAG